MVTAKSQFGCVLAFALICLGYALPGCARHDRDVFITSPGSPADTVYVPSPPDTVRDTTIVCPPPADCPPGYERHHGKCRKRHQ